MQQIHLSSLALDYKKVYKVIWSCKCEEHLDAANKLIIFFYKKHNNLFLFKRLKKRFWFKKKLILTR